MALTAEVKNELAAVRAGKTTVRAAELATVLRFSGGLQVISSRIAVESELDTEQLAKRVHQEIGELYGVRSDISVISAGGGRRASHYLVRVLDGGETLA
ncbi:MAG: DNA-binding protein WhiA, partial [Salinibacterium sp.]